jgi:hypothetical protein
MKEILVDKNGNEIKNGDKVRIIIDKIDDWGNYFHDGIYDVEFSKIFGVKLHFKKLSNIFTRDIVPYGVQQNVMLGSSTLLFNKHIRFNSLSSIYDLDEVKYKMEIYGDNTLVQFEEPTENIEKFLHCFEKI